MFFWNQSNFSDFLDAILMPPAGAHCYCKNGCPKICVCQRERRLGQQLLATVDGIKLIVLLGCKVARQGAMWEPAWDLCFVPAPAWKDHVRFVLLVTCCNSWLFSAILMDACVPLFSPHITVFFFAPRIILLLAGHSFYCLLPRLGWQEHPIAVDYWRPRFPNSAA